MIKTIFFDYDGVLTVDKTGSLTTARYIGEASGVDPALVLAAFRPYSKALTLGHVTHGEIWSAVCGSLGRALDIELLREAFDSTPVNTRMFAVARQLRGRYSVGIITDNKKDRIDRLRTLQNLDALFSPIVVSAELGASKETPAIFVHALHRAGASPAECVFVDNNEENLVAARSLGIVTILHDDERNDIDALLRNLQASGVVTGNA